MRGLLAVLLCAVAVLALPGVANASPTTDKEWWFAKYDMSKVWAITKGAGVTVVVADSGVDASRGDLQGAIAPNPGIPNYTTTDGADDVHGTRMASFIAGRGTTPGVMGIAPAARILPVHVDNLDSDLVSMFTALSGLANPPQIVNMSVGQVADCPADLQAAILKAVQKGMILIASSGNSAGSSSTYSSYPANCVGVVAVTAVDSGGAAWDGNTTGPYVTLSAPGVNMPGYKSSGAPLTYTDGTSDAAAIVSGIAALVRAKNPTLSSRDLVTRLFYTAKQFSGAQGTRNDTTGYGVARPLVALQTAAPANAPNPVYDAVDQLAKNSGGPSGSGTGTTGPGQSSTGDQNATGPSGKKDSNSNTGLLIGLVVAVIVVIILVGVLVSRRSGRRRTPTGPA